MRLLTEFSLKRPVTSIMIFIALCVLGLISWMRIPLELFPSGFSGNSLWLSVPYVDAQPQEIEDKLTLPIEDRLSDIQGLKSIRSRSESGSAGFSLEFHRSLPMSSAYNAVMDRMERTLPDLPDDAQRFFLYKWDMSDAPIMWTGVGMEGSSEEKYKQLYKRIVPRLKRVPGIGDVRAWGPGTKQIFINFSRDALHNHRLSQYDLLQKLRSENFQLPSGRLVEEGKVRYVRSLSRLDSLEALRSFPASENIQLSDVADVQYRLALSADIARIQGKDGAGLGIRKESDANTVETARVMRETMAEIQKKESIEFYPFFDQGKLIEESLNNLETTALTGGFFAICVLFFFLRNLPMTLLIAASIPFTLVLSVAVTYLSGGSLNILSLMGMMIAVGMVVDNAIVVVESIYSRRLDGEEARSGAVNGASEVALAITMSTLTTVAVFLPVIVMNRDADFSFFLGIIGFPIFIALGASLLSALAFTPLTTTVLKARQISVPPWIQWMIGKYRKSLHWIFTHRSDAVFGFLAILILTSIPIRSVGCAEGDQDERRFEVGYSVPPQYSYYDRLDVVNKVEAFIEENEKRWGVEFLVSRLDGNSNHGESEIYMFKDHQGEIPRADVLEEVKKGLPVLAGVRFRIGWGDRNSDKNKFGLTLRGDKTDRLGPLGDDVKALVERLPGVLSVEKDLLGSSPPELQLIVDRDAAARFGVSTQTIAWTVASALRSNQLPEQLVDGEEVDVIARFRLEDRANIDRLLQFPIFSFALRSTTPLSSLVHVETQATLGTIHRRGRRTAYPLTINLDKGAEIKEVRSTVNQALSQLQFPTGYGFDPPFDPDDLADNSAMTYSMLMSIALVFLIMGALFESFLLPLVIITAVPMAALGAYWVLYFTGTGMNSIAGIGMVILIGVVVNNGIVLIEVVNRFRKEGMTREQALLEGGARRLRPILMTALTTICGILPMAMGGSASAGISYGPMGRVVAGGLAVGTFLTLFFMPLMYLILDDMRAGATRWLGWLTGKRATETLQ